MSKKLTPWFPDDVKPVRPGSYEVRGRLRELPYPYHYFDGVNWLDQADSKPAPGYTSGIAKFLYGGGWRGLAEKP